MDEHDYAKIQGAGSYVSAAELFTCLRCGNVVADRELHDNIQHKEE